MAKLHEWTKPYYGISHYQTERYLATINEYTTHIDVRIQVWPAQSFINFAGEKTFYGETRMEDARQWSQTFIARLEGKVSVDENPNPPMGGGGEAASILLHPAAREPRVLTGQFTGLAAPTSRPLPPMAHIGPCELVRDLVYTLSGETRRERKHIVVRDYFVSGGEVWLRGSINGASFQMRETKFMQFLQQTTPVCTSAAH